MIRCFTERATAPADYYRTTRRDTAGKARLCKSAARRWATLALLAWGAWASGVAGEPEARSGTLVKTNGVVRWTRAGKTEEPAAEGLSLYPGDKVRTLELSWALVQLSDASRVTLDQLTTFELQAPEGGRQIPILRFWSGLLYLFSREKPGEIMVQGNHAVAATRSTEFVAEERGDQTVFTVLDGAAVVSNALGSREVPQGFQAVAARDAAPVVQPIELRRIVQWLLYYPAVLDPDEVEAALPSGHGLGASLAAYRAGDIAQALQALPGYPQPPRPQSMAETAYVATLLQASGQARAAEGLMASNLSVRASSPAQPGGALASAVATLSRVIQGDAAVDPRPPETRSEWLALSYARQSVYDLAGARAAAATACQGDRPFGLGLLRLAELEFSRGDLRAARRALDRAVDVCPGHPQAHAIRGFLLAADHRYRSALEKFDRAIALDGHLANGWLGRGLVRFALGEKDAGRRDLQTAAAVEPNRSLLHSYLAKGFVETGAAALADKDLRRAVDLDAKDPTPFLYSALLRHSQNRVNEGITNLERSLVLAGNRRVYRSAFLLDEDRAVRSANLSRLYRSAAMPDVSLREAARAVDYDYSDYAAHLFLADSFNALRDPTRFNLRYEAAWFNELLWATLLAPVGAGALSPRVSQEEYAQLFEGNRLGFDTTSEYRSDGEFREMAAQHGVYGPVGYSVDLDYQQNEGVRPNNDLSRLDLYGQLKAQLDPQTTLVILTKYQDYASGDNFQYYDPAQAQPHYRIEEHQEPLLFAALTHEWSPGVRTTVAGTRLVNEQRLTNQGVNQSILVTNRLGVVTNAYVVGLSNTGQDIGGLDLSYRNDWEMGGGEINQLVRTGPHTVVAGWRYQSGVFHTASDLTNPQPSIYSFYFADPPDQSRVEADFRRSSAYAYYTLAVYSDLSLTAGVGYDDVLYPTNFRHPPVQAGETEADQVSPKAALVWSPFSRLTVRGLYSQSLGGVSFEDSFRLEPAQLAGFTQAYRTVISESVAGSVSAPVLEVGGGALDFKLPGSTYLGLQAQVLTSAVERETGVFYSDGDFSTFPPNPYSPGATPQALDYEERTYRVTLNRLVGREWSFGMSYQYLEADLETRYPEISSAVTTRAHRFEESELHQVSFVALWNHAFGSTSGCFAQAEARGYWQSSAGYTPPLADEAFWQLNLLVGYRFWSRRGEIAVGGLNLAGSDYHLNPLTPYAELPREPVFYARVRLSF